MDVLQCEITIEPEVTASSFRANGSAPKSVLILYRPGSREQLRLMFDGAAPMEKLQAVVCAINDLQDAVLATREVANGGS